jgi:cell division inhibitor SulA
MDGYIETRKVVVLMFLAKRLLDQIGERIRCLHYIVPAAKVIKRWSQAACICGEWGLVT